jgi:hypothetical protein
MSILSKILGVAEHVVAATADVLTGQISAAEANIAAGRQIVHGTPTSPDLTNNVPDVTSTPGTTVTTGTTVSKNIVYWILGILFLIIIMSTKKRKI